MGKVYHRRKRPSTLNKNLQMSRSEVWRALKNAPKRGKPPINQNLHSIASNIEYHISLHLSLEQFLIGILVQKLIGLLSLRSAPSPFPQFPKGFLKDKGTAVGEAACSLIADSITDKCLSNVTEDRFFHKIIHLYYNLIWLAIQG